MTVMVPRTWASLKRWGKNAWDRVGVRRKATPRPCVGDTVHVVQTLHDRVRKINRATEPFLCAIGAGLLCRAHAQGIRGRTHCRCSRSREMTSSCLAQWAVQLRELATLEGTRHMAVPSQDIAGSDALPAGHPQQQDSPLSMAIPSRSLLTANSFHEHRRVLAKVLKHKRQVNTLERGPRELEGPHRLGNNPTMCIGAPFAQGTDASWEEVCGSHLRKQLAQETSHRHSSRSVARGLQELRDPAVDCSWSGRLRRLTGACPRTRIQHVSPAHPLQHLPHGYVLCLECNHIAPLTQHHRETCVVKRAGHGSHCDRLVLWGTVEDPGFHRELRRTAGTLVCAWRTNREAAVDVTAAPRLALHAGK